MLAEVSPKNGYRFGILMEFADRSAYDRYNEHPDHIRFVQQRWLPEVSEFLELDYARVIGEDRDEPSPTSVGRLGECARMSLEHRTFRDPAASSRSTQSSASSRHALQTHAELGRRKIGERSSSLGRNAW